MAKVKVKTTGQLVRVFIDRVDAGLHFFQTT
jgi:hypothetical protein